MSRRAMRKDGRRRQDMLTRAQIIDAAVELLDRNGESGLTFQALAKHLNTGSGAIYWHIKNKAALLVAACDAIVEPIARPASQGSPSFGIRDFSGAIFDAIDNRPWIGSVLAQAPGSLPSVRIIELFGQQIRRMGVAPAKEWSVVAAILNYVLGVACQNAANATMARRLELDREQFLGGMAEEWSRLDAAIFPFTQDISSQLSAHDDRDDFLTGVDLILAGIQQSLDTAFG